MKKEDLLLFQCARQDFTPAYRQTALDLCAKAEIDWDYLYRVANYHGVAPLIYINLQMLPEKTLRLPAPIRDDFRLAVERNKRVKERMVGPLQQVLGLLNTYGLDVMMVKGNALSLFVYAQEWYTTQADVDLLIRPSIEEIPGDVLKPVVHLIETINRDYKQQEHIEFDFYLHHDISMNGILRVNPQHLWANAEPVEHYGARFYINSPEDMLLVSCINGCRKRYLRLKSMLDIAEILNRYPQLDWADLASRARSYRCNTILFTALTVSQACLDPPLPSRLDRLFAVHPVRAELIRSMIARLYQRGTLESLAYFSQVGVLGRSFSWTLLLTYLSYPNHLLSAKVVEVVRDWQRLRRYPAYRQIRPRIR